MIPLVVTLTISTVLAWRQQITMGLQEEVRQERAKQRNVAQPSEVQQRTILETKLPAVASAVEAEDMAAIARLKKEIAGMKARAAGRPRPDVGPYPKTNVDSGIRHRMLPFTAWRNVGHATPVATLETVLWAASVGEVNTLAELLSLDPVVRTQVYAMMIRLPDTIRREYDTPERFVALLTAADVPLGAAQIRENAVTDSRGEGLMAILRDTENRTRSTNLTLRQEGELWKVVVPGSAIEKYAARLSRGAK
jgi:hypothetical protein